MYSDQVKVTSILIVHLKSNFRGQPYVEYESHTIALEDDLSYTLALGATINQSRTQVVKKSETNEVHYTQVYSNVDGKTYWHFDIFVYSEISDGQSMDGFLKYWSDELKIRAMEELKNQNQMLKDMYKGIESII